jgi:PTH1 family peptidyl-tRNA hydrolase
MYKLIAGLGNPGDKYLKTRHNYGFLAVDIIKNALQITNCTSKFHSEFAQSEAYGGKVILLKPQTYMNNSGVSLSECINFYKIPLKDVLVIHDDLDLELGKIKIKVGGGSGGHNGLKSIDHLAGINYTRLRFGVAKPMHRTQVSDYVLTNFTDSEFKVVDFSLNFISNNLEDLISQKTELFLNRYAIEFKKFMEKNNEL